MMYYMSPEGPKRCRANDPARCRVHTNGLHIDGKAEAEAYWVENFAEIFPSLSKHDFVSSEQEQRIASELKIRGTKTPAVSLNFDPAGALPSLGNTIPAFTMGSYYGEVKPREVQLQALNGVRTALEQEDMTQLVAACGTGKTYMGRQLMRHFMEQPGANGIAMVLTSSIKLAQDTASDMRPDARGKYDKSLGEYGEDYEVIEVHSQAESFNDRPSVRDSNGAVSAERIRDQIESAIAQGKKVVIVSTYESSDKVQEAQAMVSNPLRAEADLLMHDEAHNILGQQRGSLKRRGDDDSSNKMKELLETKNKAYVGFANEIPGSIQARKRLYATATPVVQESDDRDSTETLARAIATAKRMQKDPRERVTFYSTDTEIVGKIGGAITQEEAISASCLAKPHYELREAVVKGNIRQFRDPRIAPDGSIFEGSRNDAQMSPQTYGAVYSTLTAMVSDPEEGNNPVHNALAYTGSIDQATAFSENFRKVALAEANGMGLKRARSLVDDEDLTLRRQARMRLLAEYADVRSAHSKSEAAELASAFTMFTGNSLTEEEAERGWSPKKKVLANVDIFSEGVSINEIDTVIVSDNKKTSERAMTQAIGRSIRVTPGNPYKSTGHVIVPQVKTDAGITLNTSSVSAASYGATRVERSLALAKLRGEKIQQDSSTRFQVYSPEGNRKNSKSARQLGHGALLDPRDVVAAATINGSISSVKKKYENWESLSQEEQNALIVTELQEMNGTRSAYKAAVGHNLASRSAEDVANLRSSGRTMESMIAAGDVGALSDSVARSLVEAGVLRSSEKKKQGATIEDKTKVMMDHAETLIKGLSMPAKARRHPLVQDIGARMDRENPEFGDTWRKFSKNQSIEREVAQLRRILSRNNTLAAALHDAIEKDTESEMMPRLGPRSSFSGMSELRGAMSSMREMVSNRSTASAMSGEVRYNVNEEAVTKTGGIKAEMIKVLADRI